MLQLARNLTERPAALASWLSRKIGTGVVPRSRFRLVEAAEHEFIERLALGVAIFGEDRRLLLSNKHFRECFAISHSQAAQKPLFEEILDGARANRKTPEQRDYAQWKVAKLELFERPRERISEVWSLPTGRAQRTTFVRNALGGITIEIEDLTDKLELLTAYNALQRTQRATLDAMEDGIAIFGPDGRLRVHNRTLRRILTLDEALLFSLPHVSRLSEAWAEQFGADDLWMIVSAAINSDAPDKALHSIARTDGRTMTLSLTRLPDGGTMVRFGIPTNARRARAQR